MYLDSVSLIRPAPRTHMRVIPERVTFTAPAQASSVRTLRSRASLLFAGWAMSPDEQGTAELVISELLTNAVMHGHDEMTLAIALTGSILEITVTDHGEPKSPTPPSDLDEHGRGLAIVAAVSRDLRVDEMDAGWRAQARIELESEASVAGTTGVRLRAA